MAAGWVMMVVNRMVSGGWQEHQDFGWLLGVGRFFGQWRIKKLVVAREILMAVGFLEIVVANRISVL